MWYFNSYKEISRSKWYKPLGCRWIGGGWMKDGMREEDILFQILLQEMDESWLAYT